MTSRDNIKAFVAKRLRPMAGWLALAFLGLLPYSCTREVQPSSGRYDVSVKLDTRSINTGEVGSIAIYAFSDVNDADGSGNLVGYLYESRPDASGVFPMSLTDCGAVDFYVILNPDSDCFDFTSSDGSDISIDDTPPSGITPGVIRSWRIKYDRSHAVSTPPSEWMLPMSNLDGAARGNRRFEIEDKPGLQEVPISVTRAVSKVEVWFRSEDVRSWDERFSGYWTISRLGTSDPVASSGLFIESADHVSSGAELGLSDNDRYNYMNCDFPEDADESSFYQEDNFTKIFEYYTLPNTVGGNTAGETPDGTNSTTLEVGYYWKPQGSQVGQETKTKTVYLPAYPRNSCIRIWCALPGEEDRTFTYTVIDWDETVTVNIPDFS